mgnify:CR=1 FL=1
MVAAGLAGLGRYTRFVSHSVMKGLLTGVAVNIILGQIPDLTGADAEGSIALAKAVDVLIHPSTIDAASLATGLAAAALMVPLARTRCTRTRMSHRCGVPIDGSAPRGRTAAARAAPAAPAAGAPRPTACDVVLPPLEGTLSPPPKVSSPIGDPPKELE